MNAPTKWVDVTDSGPFWNGSVCNCFLTNNPEADIFKNHLLERILDTFQDDWFELDKSGSEYGLRLRPRKVERYLARHIPF